jgi:hypothetical protein
MSSRYRNVTTTRTTRIAAAPSVQPISSGVLPRIWCATPSRRARYFTSDQINTPQTSRKITIPM